MTNPYRLSALQIAAVFCGGVSLGILVREAVDWAAGRRK